MNNRQQSNHLAYHVFLLVLFLLLPSAALASAFPVVCYYDGDGDGFPEQNNSTTGWCFNFDLSCVVNGYNQCSANGGFHGYGQPDPGDDPGWDNCPGDHNPDQLDQDMDGLGDYCDPDDDGDGMDDDWEDANGLDSDIDDSLDDPDSDGANNLLEFQLGTNPQIEDNDLDSDGFLNWNDNCMHDHNPTQLDTDLDLEGDACDLDDDNDGMPDSWELTYGLNPIVDDANGDLDADGGSNFWEYQNNLDPTDPEERPYWHSMILGDGADYEFGRRIRGAGDINNDDYVDFLVGSPGGPSGGNLRAYSSQDLSILQTFVGAPNYLHMGWAITGLGDLNQDGYDDFAIGLFESSVGSEDAGEVKVISGIDGSELFQFFGDNIDDAFGGSVSSSGDVNNDGINDLIIGATINNNDGYVKVINGSTGGLLYQKNGSNNGSFGKSVDGVGDLNLDGYDDFIIGEPDNSPGYVRVYSGIDGSQMYAHQGLGNGFGSVVRGIGDMNNDGYPDYLASAPGQFVRIYSGKTGSPLRIISNSNASARFGHAASSAGDFNNDGYIDILIGDYLNSISDTQTGRVYIYSGSNGALITELVGFHDFEWFGIAVESLGDIDSDGYDDIIIGAKRSRMNGIDSGSVRIYSYSLLINDHDRDYLTNAVDPDDDNDGTPDINDDFPLDPTESTDTDGDGQGNNADGDDDNDGLPDPVDADPLDDSNTNEVSLPVDGGYTGKQHSIFQ